MTVYMFLWAVASRCAFFREQIHSPVISQVQIIETMLATNWRFRTPLAAPSAPETGPGRAEAPIAPEGLFPRANPLARHHSMRDFGENLGNYFEILSRSCGSMPENRRADPCLWPVTIKAMTARLHLGTSKSAHRRLHGWRRSQSLGKLAEVPE